MHIKVIVLKRGEFTDQLDALLQQRSQKQYNAIVPYLRGSIYGANPYLMIDLNHIHWDYLFWARRN